MFRTVTCVHCGTHQNTLFRITPGKKIRCLACGNQLPPAAMEDLLHMQGLMRMGDDDEGGGGGGDWGGGGKDESSEAEGEGGDDEDEDEDDGKGGKKKKKPKAKSGGGFFANILSGILTRIITAVIGFGLLGACCCCAIGFGYFFPSHPLVGEWEASVPRVAKVDDKNKDGKKTDADKDKDGKKTDADKKDAKKTDADKDGKKTDIKDKDKEEPDDVDPFVIVKMKIDKGADDKSGTGVYTNADGVQQKFKWRDFDKEKKTVVFEMDNKDDTFWAGLKGPVTFTFETGLLGLTLTSGAEVIVFTHPVKDQPAPAKNVGGGKKKKK